MAKEMQPNVGTFQDGVYSIYLKLFEVIQAHPGRIDGAGLTGLMTSLFAAVEGSWLVVGVTKKALSEYAKVGFRHKAGVFCRGHLVDRAETRKRFFERKAPLSSRWLWKIYFENDRTVLMLNEENKGPIAPDRVVWFEAPDPALFRNKSIGYAHGLAEAEYLRTLYKRIKGSKGRKGSKNG